MKRTRKSAPPTNGQAQPAPRRIPYSCATPHIGLAPQHEVLRKAGHSDKEIETFTEKNAKTRETFRWITNPKGSLMRPSQNDMIEVSDLHVLVNNSDEFGRVIDAVANKNGILVEIRSGARSDQQGAFVNALHESIFVIAGRQPRADRSSAALKAAQERAERLAKDYPPMGRIEDVLNNHVKFKTELDGIAYLNKLGFRRKLNKPLVRRWAKPHPITGEPAKLNLLPRRPGPKNWND